MSEGEKQKIIADFIKAHSLGVVATAHETGQPEAAVVEYGEIDQFNIILDIFDNSRKFQNIQKNSRVAFVIGWDDNITVQYSGVAELLVGEELARAKEAYFIKNPRAKKWDGREGIVYIKITPTWIRYSDLRKYPWDVFEVTNFEKDSAK